MDYGPVRRKTRSRDEFPKSLRICIMWLYWVLAGIFQSNRFSHPWNSSSFLTGKHTPGFFSPNGFSLRRRFFFSEHEKTGTFPFVSSPPFHQRHLFSFAWRPKTFSTKCKLLSAFLLLFGLFFSFCTQRPDKPAFVVCIGEPATGVVRYDDPP